MKTRVCFDVSVRMSATALKASHLYSTGRVFLDPLDKSLINQLLGLRVQAVIGQVVDEVIFGDAEDLVLSRHVRKVLQGEGLGHVVQLGAAHGLGHGQNPQAVCCSQLLL